MSKLTRSAYGLTTDADEWYLRGLCRGQNADWWVMNHGIPSSRNRRAIEFCGACPVRERCRDDMLALPKPTGVIAGGWRWNAHAVPTPYPGDEHLLPRPVVSLVRKKPRRRGTNRPTPAAGRKFITAGRLRLTGVPRGAVAREVGCSPNYVDKAARVLTLAPELLPDLEAGRVSIETAVRRARERAVAA